MRAQTDKIKKLSHTKDGSYRHAGIEGSIRVLENHLHMPSKSPHVIGKRLASV
jgi:hypothetical protein